MSCLAFLMLGSMLLTGGPARSRPSHARGIRRIDFKNFVYDADGENVRVRRGRGSYSGQAEGDFSYSVERVQVSYGDLTGDGREEAAVTLYYTGGGTGAFSKGFVFTMRRGRLALLAPFEGGDRAAGGIREAAVEGGLLRVRRNEPERMNDVPVGLCCPVSVITTRYRWDGRGLVRVGEPEKVEVDAEN
jgi:hypothetical protein